jgi:hypothetical protein
MLDFASKAAINFLEWHVSIQARSQAFSNERLNRHIPGWNMKEHLKAFYDTINKRQILIGLVVLLLGLLVYLVDRPPDQTYFVYKLGIDISLYNILPNLFGIIGNSLPDFVHPFSFILITAGLITFKKKGYIIICLSWFFYKLCI